MLVAHNEGGQVTDEQFQSLSRSVGNLAAAVAALHSDVADLKGEVRGIKGDVAVLKEDVTGLKGDVASLKATVDHHVLPFLRRIDDRLAMVEGR